MKLSDIITNHSELIFNDANFSSYNQLVFRKIKSCRTPALGGHCYVCPNCGSSHLLYNSCRNRNCPVCQDEKRVQWVQKQCNSLLKIPYFHVVFTVPEQLNYLFKRYPNVCYNALFRSVWSTLKGFFANPAYLGGRGAMLCILHTWGQNLAFHPHLHCIVPAAGITDDGEFKIMRTEGRYLFNIKSLTNVFRAKLMALLTKLEKANQLIINPLVRRLVFNRNWVVFCQKPFAAPHRFVEYIGRYSHRVAIAESRIMSDTQGKITFTYKDYKSGGKIRTMELSALEFFRRFAMHILPPHLVKIRHYGLLSNSHKKDFLAAGDLVVGRYELQNQTHCEQALSRDVEEIERSTESVHLKICPVCKKRTMRKVFSFTASELAKGIMVVDGTTGEILVRCRAGPVSGDTLIFEYFG